MTTPDIVGFPPQLQDTPNVASIVSGAAGFSVVAGNVISSLPTADPHVVNALWNDAGVVHVSAG
jgi:hypothetical protein